MSRTLTVSEIARLRDRDYSSTLRWLQKYARKYLRRKGRRLRVNPKVVLLFQAHIISFDVMARMSRVEEILDQHERTLGVHTKGLLKIRAI